MSRGIYSSIQDLRTNSNLKSFHLTTHIAIYQQTMIERVRPFKQYDTRKNLGDIPVVSFLLLPTLVELTGDYRMNFQPSGNPYLCIGGAQRPGPRAGPRTPSPVTGHASSCRSISGLQAAENHTSAPLNSLYLNARVPKSAGGKIH